MYSLKAKERYTLTRPKAGNDIADYVRLLNTMNNNVQISNYHQFNMTMQVLREKGLCKAKNRKGYVITEKGRSYITYVNSTNKPNKKVLLAILNS